MPLRNSHRVRKSGTAERTQLLVVNSAGASERPSSPDLNATSVSSVLSEFLNSDTVLVNELGLVPEALGASLPGTYFRSGAASPLGWGVGGALGYRLADQAKTVIAAIGDGVFFLSPIHAVFLTSVQVDAPIVIIVLNNGGMASIRRTVEMFYGDAPTPMPLTSLAAEGIEIEKCAQMVSGLGLKVQTVDDLRDGIQRAIEYSRSRRRPAIINAILRL